MASARHCNPFPVDRVRAFGDGIDHSEGVAIGRDGCVYAGGELGQIYRIAPDGSHTKQLASTGGLILGLTLDRQDNIFACDKQHRILFTIDPAGNVRALADGYHGERFRLPNYTVFDRDGNLYLTDSGRFKGNDGVIYRIGRDARVELFAPGPFAFPNGMALNATEDALFVIESNLDRVIRIEIRRDGSAGDISVYCTGLAHVPDGMAFDAAGNLYVACYGLNRIYLVRPDGSVSLFCEDTENYKLPTPTNLAFGGTRLDTLYVGCLGARHLAVIHPVSPGLPLYSHSHTIRGN